ncbi:heavy-metal-associated domain-containing protein [Paenibacillus sp.]|uniref:heavy-metal-associated domain-containing protein n=1 Tax=Paenibacillus sp. TaxID=58172 RepID=UPI002D701124|nr:heavy-metal-associated domain-containing protein [Paenibacillus sp.]HZG85354.1 heavy-metal-associated domain-containing protein [Paenibacillus sp.]
MKIATVYVKGIQGDQDAKAVKDALTDVWGVVQVDVDPRNGTACVRFDEEAASEIDIVQAVVDQGYEAEGSGPNA